MPALNSGFSSMKRLGVFLLPLDGILVHRRLPPSSLSPSNLLVPIYTPGLKPNCLFINFSTFITTRNGDNKELYLVGSQQEVKGSLAKGLER